MKKNTALLIAVLLLVIGLVFAGQIYLRNQATIKPPVSKTQELFVLEKISPSVVSVSVTLESIVDVDFGNGITWSEKVAAKNVYEALVMVGEKKGVEISAKQYKYGMMVEKIGEVGNSKDSYWMYSVNSKPGQIAVDRYIISPGDKVEWVYKKIN